MHNVWLIVFPDVSIETNKRLKYKETIQGRNQ